MPGFVLDREAEVTNGKERGWLIVADCHHVLVWEKAWSVPGPAKTSSPPRKKVMC